MSYLAEQYGKIEELNNVMYADNDELSEESQKMYRILNNVTYQ